MRDLISRGQRCDNGEWVYGYLVKKHDPLLGIAYSFILVQEMDHSCITGEPTILRSEMTWFKVEPKSVGEFTGLTANGTRVFEGDVVEFCDIKGVVNYNTGCFCVKTNKPDWKSRNNPAIDIVFCEYENEVEVIGNIHDNPELLEGERKDNE